MSTLTPFRIPVADLMRRPGSSRAVHVEGPVAELRGPGAEVPAERAVVADLTLEHVSDGIVVRGTVAATWHAPCSRCLTDVDNEISVHVDEMYERHPLEGETYALVDDIIDLELLVRDALVLELPAVPLCRDDCKGLCPTCGIDRNAATCECRAAEPDPRWAPLRSLDL